MPLRLDCIIYLFALQFIRYRRSPISWCRLAAMSRLASKHSARPTSSSLVRSTKRATIAGANVRAEQVSDVLRRKHAAPNEKFKHPLTTSHVRLHAYWIKLFLTVRLSLAGHWLVEVPEGTIETQSIVQQAAFDDGGDAIRPKIHQWQRQIPLRSLEVGPTSYQRIRLDYTSSRTSKNKAADKRYQRLVFINKRVVNRHKISKRGCINQRGCISNRTGNPKQLKRE